MQNWESALLDVDAKKQATVRAVELNSEPWSVNGAFPDAQSRRNTDRLLRNLQPFFLFFFFY